MLTEYVEASLRFGDKQWSVKWDRANNCDEYMIAQFAFEARQAATRELKEQVDAD